MAHFPFGLLAALLFGAMLLFPKAVFNGAAEGLLLWFQIVFPTLFPFMVITNLLMETGGLDTISRILYRPFRTLFRVSEDGSFAVLAGFLCGYPMGAKVTADLLRAGRITREEGQYLLSFCNNASPVFIVNFIVWKTFGKDRLAFPTLLILTAAPILLSFVFRRFYLGKRKAFPKVVPDTLPLRKRFDFSMLDACMMNSFEGIVKVGGYIILFSVLIALFEKVPGKQPFLTAALPLLEMTNGILMLRHGTDSFLICYPCVSALTAFGGLCSAAQTRCMIQDTELKLLPYFLQKTLCGIVAGTLALLYVLV